MLSEYLIAGEVLKPQGLDGLVKVRVDMDAPEMMLEINMLYTNESHGYQTLPVTAAQIREGYAFLRFEGINNREAAEILRGKVLYMKREEAPKLPEGRYYICDLIGCGIYTRDNKLIGTIREVMQPGANDVYVADTSRGEMLLPVLKHVIIDIDVIKRAVYVDEDKLDEVAVFGD